MKLTFFEIPAFTRHLRGYLDDEGYRDLQNALMEDPKRGAEQKRVMRLAIEKEKQARARR